jgi:hypothetical protein
MDKKVIAAIGGKTHPYYEKVVQGAIFAKKIVTGEDYGSLIYNYRPRESDEQKEQRREITHVRTKSIAGKVTGFFEHVTREDKLVLSVSHEASEEKANQLSKHLDIYGNNGESAIKWVERAANFYNDIDSNVFYWVKESVNKDGEQEFEPFIFTSEQVLDYSIKKGLVEWLVVKLVDNASYMDGEILKAVAIDYYY